MHACPRYYLTRRMNAFENEARYSLEQPKNAKNDKRQVLDDKSTNTALQVLQSVYVQRYSVTYTKSYTCRQDISKSTRGAMYDNTRAFLR